MLRYANLPGGGEDFEQKYHHCYYNFSTRGFGRVSGLDKI